MSAAICHFESAKEMRFFQPSIEFITVLLYYINKNGNNKSWG